MNGNRITEFGFVQIIDADFSRVSQVNGGAVGQVKPGGYLDRPNCLPRCHRSHGYHKLRRKRSGGGAFSVGDIHRERPWQGGLSLSLGKSCRKKRLIWLQRLPYDPRKISLDKRLHGILFYAHGPGTFFRDQLAVPRANNNWNIRPNIHDLFGQLFPGH